MMKSLMVRKSLSPAKKNNKGFTLIELIIVIAIIAVLAAVVAPQYLKYVDKSKAATDVNTVSAIEQAVNVLCSDGTITATTDDAVTWTASSGALSGTYAAEVAQILGKATTSGGTTTYSTNAGKSAEAVNVKFTVTVASGTPSVTSSVNYQVWAD